MKDGTKGGTKGGTIREKAPKRRGEILRHIMKEKAGNSGRRNTSRSIMLQLRNWISKFQ